MDGKRDMERGLCPNATWDCETTDCAFKNQVRKKQLSAEKV